MPGAIDYLLIGHITADLIPDGRLLGGTVSYAARAAHAFGLRVGALISAAPDEPLLEQLAPYAEIVSLPAESTTTFENIYEPSGRIQFIRGCAAPIPVDAVPTEWLDVPLVHIAPIADEVDPAIARRFSNSRVLLTLQGLLRRWDADGRVQFKRWHDPEILKSIDIVVFSEEDIVAAPELEAEFAATTEHLLVTRAEKGGTYYLNGQPSLYDTPQTVVVHPTGAGDIFAASLLASLHVLGERATMDKAIHVAAQLAATSVTRLGLDSAPTAAEVQAVLAAV